MLRLCPRKHSNDMWLHKLGSLHAASPRGLRLQWGHPETPTESLRERSLLTPLGSEALARSHSLHFSTSLNSRLPEASSLLQ